MKIDKEIKDIFSEEKPIGRLIPLIVNIEKKEDLEDLKEIIKYKIGQK